MSEGEKKKVGAWKRRIAICKKVYEPSIAQWSRYKKYYENDQWFDPMYDFPEVEDRITVNQVFPMIKTMLNSTYSKNPYIYVRPAKNDDQSFWGAKILEPFLNSMWNKGHHMKRMMRRTALDTLLRGKGFVRSGYAIETLGDTVFKDRLVSERVSPLHFWLDPEAETTYDAYYSIRRVIMPWVDVKRLYPRKNIKPAAKHELAPVESDDRILEWQSAEESSDDMARAIIYEIHDHLEGKILTIAEGNDSFLSVRENPYNITGTLIDELCFNEIPETPFGLPDVAIMEGQQLELNRLRTMMLQHVRRFLRKYLTTRNNFDEDDKKALESNEDGVLVECDDPGAVIPLKDAPLSGDVHIYEQKIMSDITQLSGVNPWMKGDAMHPRKSAFEAQQMSAGSSLRATEKPALMEDFASRIADKQVRILQQFLDSPIVDSIPFCPLGIPLDQTGRLRAFSREDIQGEYNVVVKPNSTQLPDKAQEQQMAMMMMQSGMAQDPKMGAWFWQYFTAAMGDSLPGLGKAMEAGMQSAGAGGGQQQQQQMQQGGGPQQ